MFAKYVQTVLPVASKISVSSGIFSRQPSNSCTSARPQNPLPARMGGSAGADSKQCFTKMPDSSVFFLNCQTKYLISTTLQVLEACMKNCGRRFHNEVGKYRFLNELIKVVSPMVSCLQIDFYLKRMKSALTVRFSSLPGFQYMGDSAPEKVKMKIVEMLYSWTVAFPNEVKISEAYQTLKRQGTLRCPMCLWKGIRPQWNRINPALTPFTRSGDTRPRDPTGQDSDPLSSNTTQTSRVWQRGHGQGDRLYEHTGTVLKTDLKQNKDKVDKKCSTIICCRWSTGWSSHYGDIHMFTYMSKLGVGIIVIEVGVEKM